MYVFKYEETHKAMVSVEESMFAERRLVLEPSKEITAAAMAGDESKVFAWLDGWSWSEAVKLGQPGEELIATIVRLLPWPPHDYGVGSPSLLTRGGAAGPWRRPESGDTKLILLPHAHLASVILFV